MVTLCDKNGIFYHFAGENGIVLHTSSKIGQVEPETAALGPLEVPVEPRAAAVEHVAAPVEPVVVPMDKDSRGLVFLLAALPRCHILMRPGPYQ